jgi:hypothetical protein
MLENNKKIEISRQFCQEVKELAKKYNLPFFVVTDGASAISNNVCAAVKKARDNHIKWEKENGCDPYEDWSKINKKI